MTPATVVPDLSDSQWWGTDRGVTVEARSIPNQVTAFLESLSDGPWLRRACREALAEAYRECSVRDWDGYGAEPADSRSASRAAIVVASLVPKLGMVPDFSFDPDGEAMLEWYWGPDRVLDMIVGSNGEIHYAARIDGAKEKGVEQYSDGLPPRLVAVVTRLVG